MPRDFYGRSLLFDGLLLPVFAKKECREVEEPGAVSCEFICFVGLIYDLLGGLCGLMECVCV